MEHLVHCCGNYFSSEIPPLSIVWFITRNCNQNCSYCLASGITHSNKKEFHINLNLFKMGVDNIEQYINTPIQYQLTGGEPTTHPNFFEILKILKDKNPFKITIFTNISSSLKYLEDIFSDLDFKRISFNVSIHLEYHQTIKKMYSTISKIKLLNSFGYFTKVCIFAHPDYLKNLEIIRELFTQELTQKKLCSISVVPLVFNSLEKPYEQNYKKYLDIESVKSKYIILDKNENIQKINIDNQEIEKENWIGNKCFLNLFVFVDGIKIERYPCKMEVKFNKHIIFPETIKQLNKVIYKPSICSSRYCHCIGLTQVPKINPIATKEQITKVLGWYNE